MKISTFEISAAFELSAQSNYTSKNSVGFSGNGDESTRKGNTSAPLLTLKLIREQ